MSDKSDQYKDQSARQLRYTLVCGWVDLERFTVLVSKTLSHIGFNIEAGIIGESHYVVVSRGNTVLTEVFACVDAVSDKTSMRMYCCPLGDMSSTLEAVLRRFTYSFDPRHLSWEEGEEVLTRIEHDIWTGIDTNAPEIGLIYEFPKQPGDNRVPKTVVRVYPVDGKAIVIETVHAYPNENAVVHTRSTIGIIV